MKGDLETQSWIPSHTKQSHTIQEISNYRLSILFLPLSIIHPSCVGGSICKSGAISNDQRGIMKS